MGILHDFGNTKATTVCQLLDGTIREYDACADMEDAYDKKIFTCIGKGVFYSFNGTLQNIPLDNKSKHEYFFVKTNP